MKKWILLLLIAFGASAANAQVFLSVAAGKKIFNMADTICYPSTPSSSDYYFIYVKNTGSSPFSGTAYLNIGVDTIFNSMSWTPLPPDSFPQTTINPGDSVPFGHIQLYDSSTIGLGHYYRMGGNIVVIWPSAQGAITVDSSEHDTVYILNCATVNEIIDGNGISLFPNPCSENISIHLNGNVSISTISVLNIEGELLKEYASTNTISFAEFSAGMYFLKIEFADKTISTYKVIRRE